MIKTVAFIFLLCGVSVAQISGAGQFGCNGAPVSGTAWSSGTANNTSQTLATNVTSGAVLVTLDQTTTLTGGAVTLQGDPGDGNVVTLASWQVVDPTTAPFATIGNPYTLQASTNKQFLVLMGGMYKLILKLTTAITGTGTITPNTTPWCGGTPTIVYQATGANFANNAAPIPTALSGQAVVACNILSAASNNSTNCKASAGNFFGFEIYNTTTTVYYLRLYNSASAPTCSSATGFIRSIPIPPAAASGQEGGIVSNQIFPTNYGTGIGYCITGGSSSTDNTNAATGIFGEIRYE